MSPVLSVEDLAPLSLADIDARAGLQRRIDRKYLVPQVTAAQVVAGLADTHGALEIDGLRSFAYSSWYFDTACLATYRAHVQGRRRRFKVRTRSYLDSGLCLLEVKLKGHRGETVKLRRDAPAGHGVLDATARDFVAACVSEHYGWEPREDLSPTIEIAYRRLTLASHTGSERVTIDLDLGFRVGGEEIARLRPGYVIVESKSESGASSIDRRLRQHGLRPLDCSKYCVGIALARERPARGGIPRLGRRYFERVDAGALSTTAVPGVPALLEARAA